MIVGLTCVRNDEDILEDTLRYHLENEGVDRLGIIEHHISDKASAILDQFQDVIASRIRVTQEGFYPCVWLNELRREMQHTLSLTPSDWFVHFDADERWEGLREAVEGVPDDVLVIESDEVVNYLPDMQTIDAENILGCDKRPKIMIRAASDLSTMTGQHRAVLNSNAMPVPEEQITDCGFTVRHYPVRSADQFLQKIQSMKQILDKGVHPEGGVSYWLWREWVSVLNTGGENAVRDLFNEHLAIQPKEPSHTL